MIAKQYTAFGESKTFRQWLADPRCVVKRDGLRHRVIRGGWDMERALTQPDRFVIAEQKKAKLQIGPLSAGGAGKYPPLVRVDFDIPTRITNSSSRHPYVPPVWGR